MDDNTKSPGRTSDITTETFRTRRGHSNNQSSSIQIDDGIYNTISPNPSPTLSPALSPREPINFASDML